MTKEDYMKFPKDRLAELLAQKDLKEEFASGVYCGWVPSIHT